MTRQVQDFSPDAHRLVIHPVIVDSPTSARPSSTFTANSIVIHADLDTEMSVTEFAAVIIGESEIRAGEFVTLDDLERSVEE